MKQINQLFEYDIFLCFSSRNKPEAKSLWQKLSSCGLRVFWSDETLKQNVGESFFGVIEKALMASKHFVLLCTAEAMQSRWVRLEYESFFSHCHILEPQTRRLIIFHGKNFDSVEIPLFLKNIQCTQSINEIILITGGTDIRALQKENKALKEQLTQKVFRIDELKTQNVDFMQKNEGLEEENKALRDHLFVSSSKVDKLQTRNTEITQINKSLQKKINTFKQQIKEIKEQKTNTTRLPSLKRYRQLLKIVNSTLDRLWLSNRFVIILLWCFTVVVGGFVCPVAVLLIFNFISEGYYLYSFLSFIISVILLKFILLSNSSHKRIRLKYKKKNNAVLSSYY